MSREAVFPDRPDRGRLAGPRSRVRRGLANRLRAAVSRSAERRTTGEALAWPATCSPFADERESAAVSALRLAARVRERAKASLRRRYDDRVRVAEHPRRARAGRSRRTPSRGMGPRPSGTSPRLGGRCAGGTRARGALDPPLARSCALYSRLRRASPASFTSRGCSSAARTTMRRRSWMRSAGGAKSRNVSDGNNGARPGRWRRFYSSSPCALRSRSFERSLDRRSGSHCTKVIRNPPA